MDRTMGIAWKEAEQHFAELEQVYLAMGKQAIPMNHYDLEEETDISAGRWQEFLLDARVAEWINKEFSIIKGSELKKMVVDINDSRSVGQAQVLGSLNKMVDEVDSRTIGPAFIFCYVPPDKNQEHLENVRALEEDVLAQS